MKTRAMPLFLEKSSYKKRRLRDAARFLPVVATLLFLLPLLFADGLGVGFFLYLIFCWIALILVALIMSRKLFAEGRVVPVDDKSEATRG